MDKTKSIKNWGWSIPDILLERTDLDMYEKVLIAIMGRLGALEKPIFPRQKWLAEKMGISESGIRKILKRLQNKKIVKYEGKKWKIAIYSLTDLIGWSSPTQQDGDSQTHQDTHKKDIQSKDIQIKISEQSSPVSLIRNYFINQCKLLKNFEPEMSFGKEGKLLKDRLKRYTPEQLKDLIDQFMKSRIGEDLGFTLSMCLSAGVINQWLGGKLEKPKKPYYQGNPMCKMRGKWKVFIQGEWKEFADSESKIIYE
jgi:hypothetical protein